MGDYIVSFLCEQVTLGTKDDIIAVAHVMQTANGTISEHGFMLYSVAIGEKGIPSLLIIGYHSDAK